MEFRIVRQANLNPTSFAWLVVLSVLFNPTYSFAQSDPGDFATVIDLPEDQASISGSIGSSTQLNVFYGGAVDSFFSALSGSELNIYGGAIAHRFTSRFGSIVNSYGGQIGPGMDAIGNVTVYGGNVGEAFDAKSGSEVAIHGGTFGEDFLTESGSTVLITGGSFGKEFSVQGGDVIVTGGKFDRNFTVTGTVDIRGGEFGDSFTGKYDSHVFISGGSFGDQVFMDNEAAISGGMFGRGFEASFYSDVTLVGGEFQYNGSIPSGSFDLWENDHLFTGTLRDGSVFIFAGAAGDALDDIHFETVTLPPPTTSPLTIRSNAAPRGLRPGEVLTVANGGVLPSNFASVGALLHINGGSVGDGLELAYTELSVTDGNVGDNAMAYDGAVVDISGGTFGSYFEAWDGSVVTISDGSCGDRFGVKSGSSVYVEGGTFGDVFNVELGGDAFISGGEFGDGFTVTFGGEVHLTGTGFLLDGNAIAGLNPGETITIRERNVTLSGVLADGSSFSLDLNTTGLNDFSRDYFSSDATLKVSLIEPEGLAGDYNGDGHVNLADYTVWRDHLGAPEGTLVNDHNGGVIGVAQYNAWKTNFGASLGPVSASVSTVPEPSTPVLFSLAGALAFLSRYRRRPRPLE
jgi:hypothetical protein